MLKINSKKFVGFVVALAIFAGVSASAWTATVATKITKSSSSSDVMWLQQTLNAVAKTTLAEDGKYGKMTTAAIKAFQVSKGLSADGIAGKMTIAALNAAGATLTTGGSTPVVTVTAGCPAGALFNSATGASCATAVAPSTLSGGAGNIASTTLMGSPSNVQVGEGSTGTAVLGFQVRADAGSDLSIQNVRVNLTNSSGSGSTWPSRYLAGLSVWQGATKVGSVNTASLSQNGTTYNATIALTGAKVAANTTSNFTVAVDVNSSIDSADANATFTVFVDSIRYTDASNAVLTTSVSGITQPMRFLKLSSSASVKLTLSEDASNPKDHTVTTNYTSTTNDVSLLKFNLAAAGSDMYVETIALPVTATGVTDANQITSYYKLKYNGRVISSFTDTQSGTTPVITFGDDTIPGSTLLDGSVASVFVPAGTVASFEVVADVKSMCAVGNSTSPCTGTTGTQFDAGDTLKVDFPSATFQSSDVFVEDQVGNELGYTSTNRTGSATGYAATFRIEGLSSTLSSASVSSPANTNGQVVSSTYTMKVAVTAVGNDFFLPTTAAIVAGANSTTVPALGSPTAGVSFVIKNGSGNYVAGSGGSGALVAGAISTSVDTSGLNIDGASGRIKVAAGTTVVIPFTVSISETSTAADVAGQYKIGVLSMNAANTGSGSLTAFATTPVSSFESAFNTPAFQ